MSESAITPVAASELPRRSSVWLAQAANLLSASRFAFAGIWLAAFFSGHRAPDILLTIALAAAASDILDGRLARWTRSAGDVGRWLDNLADVVFVLTALGCEAGSGIIPFYIPALIALSFSQYAIDSVLLRGSAIPIRSRLGHWGGIVNYVLVILLAWTPAHLTARLMMQRLLPLIAVFYLAAILERTVSYWPIRRSKEAKPQPSI